MATIEVGGAKLWYEFNGDGETIVQIGGAVSAHEGYATITPELSTQYRVLDYDHRGYGLSDRTSQRYTIDTWCDDLAALMEALDVQRAHIHGGSMGSFIAINFAAHHPEKVDKLLLGAGAVAKCDRMATLHFRVWQYIAQAYGISSRELAEELLTKAFSRAYLDGMDDGEQGLSAMREVTARNASLPVFVDACQVMIDTDVRDRLASITAETLVMVGSEDVLTPLEMGPDGAGARYVARQLPNSRLEIFEGSGHGHYIEQANKSIEVILDFLGS